MDITNVDPRTILSDCSPRIFDHDHKIARFIEKCIEVLPRIELPVACGWTGYINPLKDADLTKYGNCWCKDAVGRVVIVLGKKLMFQRYQSTGLLMVSPITGWKYARLDPDSLDQYYQDLGLKNQDNV